MMGNEQGSLAHQSQYLASYTDDGTNMTTTSADEEELLFQQKKASFLSLDVVAEEGAEDPLATADDDEGCVASKQQNVLLFGYESKEGEKTCIGFHESRDRDEEETRFEISGQLALDSEEGRKDENLKDLKFHEVLQKVFSSTSEHGKDFQIEFANKIWHSLQQQQHQAQQLVEVSCSGSSADSTVFAEPSVTKKPLPSASSSKVYSLDIDEEVLESMFYATPSNLSRIEDPIEESSLEEFKFLDDPSSLSSAIVKSPTLTSPSRSVSSTVLNSSPDHKFALISTFDSKEDHEDDYLYSSSSMNSSPSFLFSSSTLDYESNSLMPSKQLGKSVSNPVFAKNSVKKVKHFFGESEINIPNRNALRFEARRFPSERSVQLVVKKRRDSEFMSSPKSDEGSPSNNLAANAPEILQVYRNGKLNRRRSIRKLLLHGNQGKSNTSSSRSQPRIAVQKPCDINGVHLIDQVNIFPQDVVDMSITGKLLNIKYRIGVRANQQVSFHFNSTQDKATFQKFFSKHFGEFAE